MLMITWQLSFCSLESVCVITIRIRFTQAFWHSVQMNVAHRFCITGLGAQSSKPFVNHTPNGIPELSWQCWYHMQRVQTLGGICRSAVAHVRNSHHGYSGNTLLILEYAYLSLWHLVRFNLFWPVQDAEKQHNRRSETQHLGWKERNSVGSVSLILAILKNRCLL